MINLTRIGLAAKVILPLGAVITIIVLYPYLVPQIAQFGKITIKPETNFNKDFLNCISEENILNPEIVSPANNSQSMRNDVISFEGKANFKCEEYFKPEDLRISWVLDNGGVISNELKFNKNDISAGDHNVKLNVSIQLQPGNILEKSMSITLRVNNPVNPPPPVAEKPNTAPVATILSPSIREEVVLNYDRADQTRYSYQFKLVEGTGVDAEDGNLNGASLQWSYQINGRAIKSLGAGSQIAGAIVYASSSFEDGECVYSGGTITIFLRVTDSKGAVGETSITLVANCPPAG